MGEREEKMRGPTSRGMTEELLSAARDFAALDGSGGRERTRAMFRLFKAAEAYVREQTKLKNEVMKDKRRGRRSYTPAGSSTTGSDFPGEGNGS